MASMGVGDIIALSQISWRIAAWLRAVKVAPADVRAVNREADGLSEALRLLAETLHLDGSILFSADDSLKQAVATILQSARTTLEDLESLIDRYTILKKTKTQGGFVVEKCWSDIVLVNYKQMIWTTEKGDIQALRNVLQMHANTISLTMQAIQTKSIVRVEKTVLPMATKVDSIYNALVASSLAEKLDDVHRIIMAIANGTPLLPPLEARSQSRSSYTDTEDVRLPAQRSKHARLNTGYLSPPVSPTLQQDTSKERRTSSTTRKFSWPLDTGHQHLESDLLAETRQVTDDLHGYLDDMSISSRDIVDSFQTPVEESSCLKQDDTHIVRRDSETLPPLALIESAFNPQPNHEGYREETSSPTIPATPSSLLSSVGEISFNHLDKQAKFLKQLFRNSAKLFDDHAAIAEFTQVNPDEQDVRYATEIAPLATQCRIYVVRKLENLPHGGRAYTTSIWVLSDDFEVRVQQRLPEFPEPIPLLSFFTPEKVSLSGETVLQHHSEIWGEHAVSEIKTSWVNYIFDTAEAAAKFQSAIFGRNLLGVFKTEKTIVSHDGFRGTFAFEEQMCGIENFRLWQEDGLSISNAAGGVLALIHLSPTFGQGWIKFWYVHISLFLRSVILIRLNRINNSIQPIRVRSDTGRTVKIKDLNITVTQLGLLVRRDSINSQKRSNTEKKVSGMRIEFSSDEEKQRFLAFIAKVQEKLIPLPDIF